MKVAIVHNWSDDNKGDSAILMGILNYLSLDKKVTTVSIHSMVEKNSFEDSLYDIKTYQDNYPFIIQKVLPLAFLNAETNTIIQKAIFVLSLLRLSIFLCKPSLLTFLLYKEEKEIYLDIQSSQVVLSKGGHIFHSHTKGYIRDGFLLILAKRLKKEVIVTSQSFGPFPSKLSKFILKIILNSTDKIMCREQESIRLLKEIKVKENKIVFFPDFAFNVAPNHNERYKELLQKYDFKGAIGITVRNFDFKRSTESDFIDGIKKVVEGLIKSGNKIIIIAQCVGPNTYENDRIISKKIYDSLEISDSADQVKFVDENIDAKTLIGLYSDLKLLIGTRFHSVIFSLISSTPVFSISYSGPKAKIMQDFGMQDFVIDIENVAVNSEEMIRKINLLLMNKNEYVAKIDQVKKNYMEYFKEYQL